MYTQCPECGTVFRVTASVLRAAQGQVRCGVCDASFDALRFLTDDIDLEVNAASASRIVGASGETRPTPSRPQAQPPPPPPPPPPAAPAAEVRGPGELGAATRNRPSADEERELGEIAASLARGAQPRPAGGVLSELSPPSPPSPPTPPQPPAAADEINILEPVDIEEFVLDADGGEDIPDEALEFDLPAERWEQVFVRDPGAPLDLELADVAPTGERASAEAVDEIVLLEEPGDPLARTDEYRVPDFAAEFEIGPADVTELAPAEVAEFEPSEVIEVEVAPLKRSPPPAAPEPQEERPEEPVAEPQPGPAAPAWRPVPVEALAPHAPLPAEADGTAVRRMQLRRVSAAAAAVVLGLALVVQVVHYDRDSLAESPLVGPALAALYAHLGIPLEPRWNLAAYDVRQWGAQSEEAAGVLRLRASVINRAARAQPYPLLRVTLEDRFGAQLGRREFTPAEYLPGRSAPHELLGAGARADADLSLADPGNQAVGFELDVCLQRRGILVCGADVKAGGG